MIPPKPSHVKAVAELLDTGNFANSTEAAKAALHLFNELRSHDRTYVCVVQYGGVAVGYGPFATQKQAVKSHQSGHAGVTGGRVAFFQVLDPTEFDRRLQAIDQLPLPKEKK